MTVVSVLFIIECLGRGTKEPSGVLEMFYILIFLRVLQVCTCVNTDQALNVKICRLTKCYVSIHIKNVKIDASKLMIKLYLENQVM